MAALLVVLPLIGALGGVAASSDGWTPILPPEGASSGSGPGGPGGPGRHALAVEPDLPGSLASSLGSSLSSLTSSLGSSSYHSHVDHIPHGGHGHGHVYRPPPPRPSLLHAMPPPSSQLQDYSDHGDTCALYKAAMTQDLYFQYIQYKVHMPDLKEFTLCMWHKFFNHSSDHPLFSYAIRDTPRAILSWVSATDRSTYFSMAVDGHTLYRLNYPLRLNRWYHSCQSWNGRTGEWQVWVNAERVGRGFHNLLVNHVVKGGGVAITGQEQRQYGGGFLEGEGAPKGAGGMLGEITQLQMYTVALTAGKAYRDHKHHHGNYNSAPDAGKPRAPTTTTPAPMPESSTVNPYAPFITNGQLTPQLPIFELSAFRKNIPMPPMMDDPQAMAQAAQQAAQGQPTAAASAMLELSQLLGQGLGQGLGQAPAVSYLHMSPTAGGAAVRIPLLAHTRPTLDLDPQQHYLFKRDDNNKAADTNDDQDDKKTEKRDTAAVEDVPKDVVAATVAADAAEKPTASVKVKRAADASKANADAKKAAEEEDAAEEAAALAAEMEPQKLTAGKVSKRESKRAKHGRQPAAATAVTPEPVEIPAVRPSSPSKRELDPADQADQAEHTGADTKQKRQTLSLHGGPIDLGTDIDTSLLSQGLSGLLPHGEFLGSGGPSPSPVAYVEFHGNNHQQLLTLPPSGPKMPPPPQQQQMQQQMQQGPPPPPLKRENEPAEGEVMAVMAMCSGCAPDPFAKVNIISWQGTPKKLYSGVHYVPAKPACRKF